MRRLVALAMTLALTVVASTAALAAWSAVGTGTGHVAADEVPAATNVAAVRSGGVTTISWTPMAFQDGTAVGVEVTRDRTLPAGPTNEVVGSCAGETSGSCTDTTPEGRWTYTVRGVHGPWSGTPGTSGDVDVPPNAPTNAARSGTTNPVTITWTDNSQIEDGFRLQRNDGTGFVTAATVGADTTSATDTLAVPCGTTWQYRVVAFHTTLGDSEPSNVVAAAGPACPTGIVHVGSTFMNVTGGTLTIDRPAGTQTGDLLLLAVHVSGSAAITGLPGDWTEVQAVTQNATGQNPPNSTLRLYRRTVTASEPASYTFTLAANRPASAGISAYRNVHPTSPIHAQAQNSGNGNPGQNSLTAAAVTTTVANTQVVAFFGTVNSADHSTPTGMELRYRTNPVSYRSSSHGRLFAGTGSIGPFAAGTAGGSAWTSITVALAPAP